MDVYADELAILRERWRVEKRKRVGVLMTARTRTRESWKLARPA